jgi:hypothetical protein
VLGVFEGFTGCCINDGMGGLEFCSDFCDLCGKTNHMMLDYDVGLNVLTAGMMACEAMSTFSAAGALRAGSTF